MEITNEEQKKGYLNEQYRVFHLKDQKEMTFDYHFHDFNKIIILLSGKVTYYMEGTTYYMEPNDILLVKHHSIHKPEIDFSEPYERIIIWIRDDLSDMHCEHPEILNDCFKNADSTTCLLRLDGENREHLFYFIRELKKTLTLDGFGNELLSNTYFIQFQIYLNRILLDKSYTNSNPATTCDKQIREIMSYINSHLTENMSNDSIAERFYISKYYLMHRFKEETGYTLHNYIRQKRLLLAAEQIKSGTPAMKASTLCGFSDYSAFLRAFKKTFHTSPTQMSKLPFPSKDSSF